MKFKTFHRGGVHPAENKLSRNSKIESLPIPETVTIPIYQHIGAPPEILAKKGDSVKVGTLIAKANDFISANVHSSVSGKIQKVADIMDSSGYKKTSIIIAVEGDEWEESIDRTSELKKGLTLSKHEVIEKVKSAGIVGLGGATFPTHVKLMVPEGKHADTLVVNGVECEPYLTSDHRLMLERADEIMVGISIAMRTISAKRAIIGVEANKMDAVQHLIKKSKQYHDIEVQALKVMYPQGGEKQLLKAVLGKEVPSGRLPIEVGAVVINVGTALCIYEAVQKNKPLIERVVTVTGKNLKNPSNYMTRIGTSLTSLITQAGGLPDDTGKIVNGGPMMGKALTRVDVPVTKGTSGVITFPNKEATRKECGPCIRCAKCVSVCAMGLEPYLLSTMGKRHLFEKAKDHNILDCIECGCCSYTCPSNIPILDYLRVAKSEVTKLIRSKKRNK